MTEHRVFRLLVKGRRIVLTATSKGIGKMKRDWDLIRKQLTDIEEDRDVLADIPPQPKWTSQTEEQYEQQWKEFNAIEQRIAGHLEMLIDNGYVDGLYVQRGADGHVSYGTASPRLTMAGHDLLDTMRSSTIWEAIKSNAKKKGIELTFDVIKTLGSIVLKQLVS